MHILYECVPYLHVQLAPACVYREEEREREREEERAPFEIFDVLVGLRGTRVHEK